MKSGLLVDAISDFLDHLDSERSFDAPFLAMLHCEGFEDIHFLHGQTEFGKDFVAKRLEGQTVVQYYFQSKRGDIGKTMWEREVRPQCETIATGPAAHPSIDISLPQRTVVVHTGRLVGQAKDLIAGFRDHSRRNSYPEFEIWSREQLIERLAGENCLGQAFRWQEFGHLAWSSRTTSRHPIEIETYTRSWARIQTEQQFWTAAIEFSVVRDLLIREDLIPDAYIVFLGLVRAFVVLENEHGVKPSRAQRIDELLQGELAQLARGVQSLFRHSPSAREALIELRHSSPVETFAFVAFAAEILALALVTSKFPSDERDEALGLLVQFSEIPICHSPISDNYAASIPLITAACLQNGLNPSAWLRRTCRFIAQSYTQGIGLAPAGASVADELRYASSYWIDIPGCPPRRDSTCASAIMDSAVLVGDIRLYRYCHRVLLRSGAVPSKLVPVPQVGQFSGESGACTQVLGGEYPAPPHGASHPPIPSHYSIARATTVSDTQGRSWQTCSMGSLLRDRWWMESLFRLSSAVQSEDS